MDRERWFICKQSFDLLCHSIAVTNEIGQRRVSIRLQRRRAAQEGRDTKPICNLRQERRDISSMRPRRVKVSLSNVKQIGVVAHAI